MFKVKNCDFKYQCDKDWDELEETSDSGIRFCHECKNNVYLCLNEDSFVKAIQLGRCVAAASDDEKYDIQRTVGIPDEKYIYRMNKEDNE